MDCRHRDADEQQEVVYNRPILIKDTQNRLQSKEQRAQLFLNTMSLYKYFQKWKHIFGQMEAKWKSEREAGWLTGDMHLHSAG